MRFILFSCFAAVIVFLSAGCATVREEPPADFGHVKLKRPKNVVYEQISTRGCELQTPREVRAIAGTRQTIDVLLHNNSKREIFIKEWYMTDNYNFSIFYRRLPADRPLDPKTPYQKYTVRIPAKPLPKHAELRLMPGNRAMLAVDLPFVEQLAPGENAIFEVFVATSLHTFKISSKTFMVYTR